MESKDQRKTRSERHGVHVCNKCGWQYPNPHPSAKHRRSHKKICGTINRNELVDSENATRIPGLDDEHKSPGKNIMMDSMSPNLLEKAETKHGGFGAVSTESEQDVSEDAAYKFSGSLSGMRSDSSKENEDQTARKGEKITENFDEIQQSNGLSTACEKMETGVSDSCEVSSAEAIETRATVLSSVETAGSDSDQQVNKGSSEESNGSENAPMDTTSVVKTIAAQEIATTESDASSEHGNAMLSVPVENVEDSLHGFKGRKEMNLNQSSLSLHGTNKEEAYEDGTSESLGTQSVRLSIDKEVPSSDMLLLEGKSEQRDQDDMVLVKALPVKEHADGMPSEESVVSEDIEINGGKVEATESPFDTAEITSVSEALRILVSEVDPRVAESTDSADQHKESIRAKDETRDVDMKMVVEGNTVETKLTSESPAITDLKPSTLLKGDDVSDDQTGKSETSIPVNVTETRESKNEGETETRRTDGAEMITSQEDDADKHGSTVSVTDAVKTCDQNIPESEKKTDSHKVLGGLGGVVQGNEINGNDKTRECFAEVPVAIESRDHRDFGRLKILSEAHMKALAPSLLATTKTYNDALEAADAVNTQTAQSKENAHSVKSQNNNDSSGDLSLHSSNVCESLEATWGSVSVLPDAPVSADTELKKSNMKPSMDKPTGDNTDNEKEVDSEINRPRNPSDAAAALSKNQEIMKKLTDWSNDKQQQHVSLKILLSEEREAIDNKNFNKSAVIPRVSSTLGPGTSPDSCLPGKGEVSEEWKTPPKYQVDVKREEKKAKNRPFWKPFACCSCGK